jgi:hypothetical protein
MLGDGFSLYTDSGASINEDLGNLREEPVFAIDPIKAERLEQRLTASASAHNLLAEGKIITMEEEELVSEEERVLKNEDSLTSSRRASTSNDGISVSKHGTPRNPRKRFTKEEDKNLIEGYEQFGNDWEKIISWGKLDRSVDQVKRRFGRIKSTAEGGPVEGSTRSGGHAHGAGPSTSGSSSGVVHATSSVGTALVSIVGGNGNHHLPNHVSTSPLSDEPPRKVQKITHQPSPIASTSAPSPLELPTDTADQQQKRTWEDIKAWQDQLKAEEQRLSQLATSLRDREQTLQKRELQLQKYEETLQTKLRHTLQSLLVEQAERDREEARNKVMLDSSRLGQLVFERQGTLSEYHEVWREGTDFKILKKKKEAITAERNSIEEQRKKLKKLKAKANPSKEGENENEPPQIDEQLLQQEEIFRLRLQALKKDESELETQYAHLLFEKKLHVRELKRVSDEESSRFNNHPILHSRYLLLNLLGKGGFSEVYKAFDLQEFRLVACKIHQLNSLWSEPKKQNYTKHAVREYNIHKDLNHPRVVSLFDVFKIDNNSFCTVLEYCDGGDLDIYLKMRNKLAEREAKAILIQIFSGLKYLNEQKRPIIHYDLKPGNILFSNGGVKITDFGLSKIMEENSNAMELTSQGAGTYWYLPPECFEVGKAPPKISSKVDVWSAGVIFYQLLYGKKPFGNNCSQQKLLVEHIISKNAVVEFPAKPVVSQKGKVC